MRLTRGGKVEDTGMKVNAEDVAAAQQEILSLNQNINKVQDETN